MDENEKYEVEFLNQIKNTNELIITKCKKIVGAFKHSEILNAKLRKTQCELNLEKKIKLKQDVVTRWNSTFDMLESIILNKEALITLCKDSCKSLKSIKINMLDEGELKVIESLCDLLSPIKSLTEALSSCKSVTISLLYPSIHGLLYDTFSKKSYTDDNVDFLKVTLVKSIEGRFNYLLKDSMFLAATMLDFRFKKVNQLSF